MKLLSHTFLICFALSMGFASVKKISKKNQTRNCPRKSWFLNWDWVMKEMAILYLAKNSEELEYGLGIRFFPLNPSCNCVYQFTFALFSIMEFISLKTLRCFSISGEKTVFCFELYHAINMFPHLAHKFIIPAFIGKYYNMFAPHRWQKNLVSYTQSKPHYRTVLI